MKTTKSILMILAVTMMLPALNSCKKGEGDPFLSLKSRKARVTGEWTIDNWEESSTSSGSDNYGGDVYSSSGSFNLKINGSTITISENGTFTDPLDTYNYTSSGNGSAKATLTFEKDGVFSKKIELTNVISTSTSGGSSYTVTFNQTIETSGTWNFLSGVEEDFKKKERMILNITEEKWTFNYTDSDGDSGNGTENQAYENGEYSEIWLLTTLKNKEMVMEGTTNNTGSYTSTDNYGGTAYSSNGSSTSKGTITATLTQK